MKNFILRVLLCIIVASCFSSCATMTRWFDSTEKNRGMYTVTIKSKTKGLPVYVTEDGIERKVGNTPCHIYSDKAKIKYVAVKNGDIYQTVKLKRKDRPSIYWNFFPMYTWIWGYFVDKGTSRGRMYADKEYYVDM